MESLTDAKRILSFPFPPWRHVLHRRPKVQGQWVGDANNFSRPVAFNSCRTSFVSPSGKRAWKAFEEYYQWSGGITRQFIHADLHLVLPTRANLPEAQSDRR
jgi:hypothetical protein